MRRMLLLLLVMITLSIGAYAQNAIVTGDGNYTSVSNSRSKIPVPTGKTFTDVDKGIVYPMYITKKGKLFIIKVNKKTGKPYKSYLKLVK